MQDLGKVLTLVEKTRKGKNVLNKWGIQWIIRKQENDRLLIVALSDLTAATSFPDSMRWIQKNGDGDFDVFEIE